MARRDTNRPDPAVVAMGALAWTLREEDRAARLLALTGLSAGDLRARAGEPALLAAVLRFIEAHEPDLVACAAALDIAPVELSVAREALEA